MGSVFLAYCSSLQEKNKSHGFCMLAMSSFNISGYLLEVQYSIQVRACLYMLILQASVIDCFSLGFSFRRAGKYVI